jgi:eukaryotic-like serine/threonine-protein kinase
MGEREYSDLDGKPGRRTSGFCPGLVLDGRYRLESLLGEGGMGTVWVGSQLALQRQVAVKSLHVVAASQRMRLRREALALAAVHHPAIVEIYDYGETEGGLPYVVMELVRGESIAARLRRLGALHADEAVSLVIQILEGLAVAHRAGVVHRDIKPDNVVLASGSTALPKLLDFGIAQSERDDGTRLTLDGAFVGTPAYMAPEQMRGGVADERVDVWGVGALLYHLIAGEAPFGVRDVVAIMRRVLEEPPSYPRKALGLDGRLWGILTAALRKDPAERTPSALALREALAGWLEARGVALPRMITAIPAPLHASTSSLEPTLLAEITPSNAPVTPTSSPASRRAPAVSDDAPPSFDVLIRAKLGH